MTAEPLGGQDEHDHPIFGRLRTAESLPASAFELTEAVRELTERTVMTDVDAAERGCVARELRQLTERLQARQRDSAAWFVSHGDGAFEHVTQAGTGRLNPHSMSGAWLRPDGTDAYVAVPDPVTGECRARSQFTRAHAAEVGRVDSGPITLLLDHVISFATAAVDRGGMTVLLEVRCHEATPYDVPLLVQARYTHSDGRKHWATGEIVVDGTVTASARGLFVGTARA